MNKEFKIIKIIKRFFKSKYIGDDCAYLKLHGNFAFSSDALNENVHFRLWKLKNLFFYLGYKSLWINISDILSSGSIPKYFLLNLNINLDKFKIIQFLKGLKYLANLYKIELIGGNTSYFENISINITLLGKTIKALLRNKAKAGEGVFVYKYVGEAATGLEILESNDDYSNLSSLEKYFVKRFFIFYIPPSVLYMLEKLNIKCATDLSDSLASCLNLIANLSKVFIEVDVDNFPISKKLLSYYQDKYLALNKALYGGDDYTLLITAPLKYEKILKNLGFLKIGIVKKGLGTNIKNISYQHFK